MVTFRTVYFAVALVTVIFLTASVTRAATIFDYGLPSDAIAGGSIIDFTSVPLGSYLNMTFSDVEFTSNTTFEVSDDNAGSFNTTGRHIDSPTGWMSMCRVDGPSIWEGTIISGP